MADPPGRVGLVRRTGRGRWLVAALATVLGLFAARWVADWHTDQLWGAVHSAGAAAALGRRRLVGLGLEALLAIGAALWWWWHLRFAITAARSIPRDAPGGNARFRELLAAPGAPRWSVALALTAGWLAGSGASVLADPLLLAFHGVHFGLADPYLGYDLGFYLGFLGLWLPLHAVATAVLIGTVAVTGAIHLLAGSLRLTLGRAGIADPARRQLGFLLAGLAWMIALAFILLPLEMAAGLPHPVGRDLIGLYRTVSFLIVGVSLAVTGLSILWMVRPIHPLAVGGWAALTLALAGATWLLPSQEGWPETPTDHDLQARFNRLAFAIPDTIAGTAVAATSPGPMWDERVLARLLAPDGGGLVLPVSGAGGDGNRWILLSPEAAGPLHGVVVLADTVSEGGQPVVAPASPPAAMTGGSGVRPGATGVAMGEERDGVPAGVAVTGWLRRIALAWSLQEARLLGMAPGTVVVWERDPAQRLRRLLPTVSWTGPRLLHHGDDWYWAVDGTLLSEAFPASARRPWLGRTVGYARTDLVGLVDARGRASIYLRPTADSLAHAIQRTWSDLVRPSTDLPVSIAALGYPAPAFAIHAGLWIREATRRLGRDPADLAPSPGDSTMSARGDLPALVVEDTRSSRVFALLEGQAGDTGPVLAIHYPDSTGLEAPAVLRRRWFRLPLAPGLRDSVRARGDSFAAGRVRVRWTGAELEAWQPWWAIGPADGPRWLGAGAARGTGIGVGRTVAEAFGSLAGPAAGQVRPAAGESPQLYQARRYLREADSALRRGDLTTFGRAFAALRRVLEGQDTRPDSIP